MFSSSLLQAHPLAKPFGRMKQYSKYQHPQIADVLLRHNIRRMSELCTEENSQVFSKEIVQKLFVRDFLSQAIAEPGKLVGEVQQAEPDFRIVKNGETILTIEVYALAYTREVVEKSQRLKVGELLVTVSMHYPLRTMSIQNKLNKYQKQYPKAKQCLFLFFCDYLNEKNVMRTFYNYYGDFGHSNGALAHFSGDPYCAKEEMERVAGFFITEGHVHPQTNVLNYSEVVFMHNPFCLEEYRLRCDFFSGRVFQSYIEFLDTKPKRGEWWGRFLMRFHKNRYPDWLFLEDDIRYCRQMYPRISMPPED